MRLKRYPYFLFTFTALLLHSLISAAQENIEKSQLPGVYAKLEEAQKDCEEAMAKGDSLEVAEAAYRMGKRYLDIGDFYTAHKCFTRALRILEPLGYSENLGKLYIFMTNFYLRNEQYDEAIQLFHKSIINFRSVGAQERLMSAYIMISNIHSLRNEARLKYPQKYNRYSLDSSKYYHDKAVEIGKSLKKITHAGNIIFSNSFAFAPKDTNTYIKYYQKKYTDALKQKSANDLFFNANGIGNTYLNLSNYKEAKKWLDRALLIADSAKVGQTFDQKIEVYRQYIKLNKETENWKEALKYHEKYYELMLKAISIDRDGAVSRLKIEYDTQNKEAQLKEQQRFTRVAIIAGVIALLTSIIFFWFFRKYRILSRQNAALVSEQNHRVKNNLQQVINLLSLQSSRLDDDMAKKALVEALLRIEAVSLVHHRLYDGDRLIEIDLSTFIPELVEGILRSYNYDNIAVNYQIDNSWLHVEQALPLGLIINELITNACKYAFSDNPNPELSIQCHEKDKQIILGVADNGPGFDQSGEKKTFGLKLIQLFAEKLKGKYSFGIAGNSFSLSFNKQNSRAKKNMTFQHV
jgi:two-component sensor histidine kinase